MPLVVIPEAIAQSLVRSLLHADVERAVHAQAPAPDDIRRILVGQRLSDPLDEIGGQVLSPPWFQCDRFRLGLGRQFGRDHPFRYHPLENVIAPRERRVRMEDWRVHPVVSRKAGQKRAFFQRKILELLSEIKIGGGGDTVNPKPEVVLVAVESEDLSLGVAPLDFPCQEDFLYLAIEGLLRAEKQQPRQLPSALRMATMSL